MKAFSFAYLTVLGMSVFFVNPALAHDRVGLKNNKIKLYRTYVTPQTNQEHFVRYNASRTCGKGHNTMSKQHRRNHQFRKAHFHEYQPWHSGCKY